MFARLKTAENQPNPKHLFPNFSERDHCIEKCVFAHFLLADLEKA